MREIWVGSLDREEPPEKAMATHSSILAWRIPGTEDGIGGLQSTGWERVGHYRATTLSLSSSLLHFSLWHHHHLIQLCFSSQRHEGTDFISFSLLFPQYLELYQPQSKCSINICGFWRRQQRSSGKPLDCKLAQLRPPLWASSPQILPDGYQASDFPTANGHPSPRLFVKSGKGAGGPSRTQSVEGCPASERPAPASATPSSRNACTSLPRAAVGLRRST